MTISSPTAQLAFLTSVTDHFPSCSLARSVRPAQFGQSNMSAFLIPAGISISCPHPEQDATGIGPLLGPLGPPVIRFDDPLRADVLLWCMNLDRSLQSAGRKG
jgi:hypothetical protein